MTEKHVTVPPILKNILWEFTINVLVENPDDIIIHAADYFTRLRDNRDKTDISGHLGSRAARRQSVVGEGYDPEKNDVDEVVEIFPKTDEENKRIKERIEDIFLFRYLDEEDKNEIVDVMMPREVNEGDVVIRQGDNGDFFYVIDSGTFTASIENDQGEEFIAQTYDNSGSFGELALLHNQPRAATVTATTNGSLWAVNRETFNRLVVKSAYEKRQRYMALLDSVTILRSLTEFEKMQVCDALEPKTLEKGKILFEEGDEGDGVYFVEDGKVSIKRAGQEVAQLGKGEAFGEMALLNNEPRAATVTAITDSKLAFLDAKGFERLLGPCVDIMKKRIAEYQ